MKPPSQLVSAERILTSHELASSCLRDRYGIIVPAGLDREWKLLMNTYAVIKYTGILTQLYATDKRFYHMCHKDSLASILTESIRPSVDPNKTFGAGVVYTYDNLLKFSGIDSVTHAVVEIKYSGPYLKCMYRQDIKEGALDECLLYPGFVTGVAVLEPAGRTSVFS